MGQLPLYVFEILADGNKRSSCVVSKANAGKVAICKSFGRTSLSRSL